MAALPLASRAASTHFWSPYITHAAINGPVSTFFRANLTLHASSCGSQLSHREDSVAGILCCNALLLALYIIRSGHSRAAYKAFSIPNIPRSTITPLYRIITRQSLLIARS